MEVPIHQACSQCRALKTRCVPDETDPSICERCTRLGRKCFFTPVQKRKQRRTQDQKVAELELEMRRLRALLKQKDADSQPAQKNDDRALEDNSSASHRNLLSNDSVGIPQNAKVASNAPSDIDLSGVPTDIIGAGAISLATARLWLEQYRTDLYPHFPVVYIQPEVTADVLRKTKPILFQAIMAGAARTEHPTLAAQLEQTMLTDYANRVVVNSEKSLELVQSMLVSAVWFQPSKLEKLKFFEYAQMALNMAMDLHIGLDRSKEDLTVPLIPYDAEADSDRLECRRTFLAIYVISSNISMTFRRPLILGATSYVRECILSLEQSPQPGSADLALAAWARLMMISEETSRSFSYDDNGRTASIIDLKTQHVLTALKRQLTDWQQNNSVPDISPNLMIAYYAVRLYVHEVSLYVDHSPMDFQPPFRVGNVQPCKQLQLPTVALVESMTELVDSAHAVLSVFTGTNIPMSRTLPVLPFVRVAYAAFILAKLSESALRKYGGLANFIDKSSLKVENYLTDVINHIQQMIGPNGCRAPAVFLSLFTNLREWCASPQRSIDITIGQEISKPRDHRQVPAGFHAGVTPLGSIADQPNTPESLIRTPAMNHMNYTDIQNHEDADDVFDHAMADGDPSIWPNLASEAMPANFFPTEPGKAEWDSTLVPWLDDMSRFPDNDEPSSMPCPAQ